MKANKALTTRQSSFFPFTGAAILAASISAPAYGAGTLVANPTSIDKLVGEVQSNETTGYFADASSGRIGVAGSSLNNTRTHENLIIGFTLPTLGTGQTIQSATLTFRVRGGRENDPQVDDIDVYLLSTADPSSAGIGFFLESDTDLNSDNKLVGTLGEGTTEDLDSGSDEVFTAPDYGFTFDLDASTLALLQTYYTGSNPNQNEAFFRWNFDADQLLDETNRWNIDITADSSPGFDVPTLNITTIPEPSSFLLGVIGSLALLRRRK